MIFLDSSAIYAWADTADPNHQSAVRRLQLALEADEMFLTHSYVLVESLALLQARLGVGAAVKLSKDAKGFVIEWVDAELHAAGVDQLARTRRRQISLVDQISFLVMRRHRLTNAFAYDPDFVSAGFRLLDG